jgi:CBS domain-containing protein
MSQIDSDGDGRIDFEEFVSFSEMADKIQKENEHRTGRRTCTMIIIGRVKTGISVKSVNLNRLFQPFGGGGHAKAASATIQLEDESCAGELLQQLIGVLIESSLLEQPTVGNFMTAPVLAATPTMTEKQVEDLFTRYDVRALPVVDAENNVIGIVTYKEVAAAKQRLWNKEQKRLRQKAMEEATNSTSTNGKKSLINHSMEAESVRNKRKMGSPLSGWMKQHVRLVEASMSMAEVENVLLETDGTFVFSSLLSDHSLKNEFLQPT